MSGLADWFPVFKAGMHTDSSGTTRNWTNQDLDTIVKNYKPEFSEAPIVIGHPKENNPAFGWVDAVKKEGDYLFAKCKQVIPEFAECVEKGLYKKRSISLNPDLTIRHIGFLGAVPPAVKGLADIKFSEQEDLISFDFMDWDTNSRFQSIGDIFQGLRDYFIQEKGLEVADKLFRPWALDELKQKVYEPQELIAVNAFCEKVMEELNVTDKPNEFSEELKTAQDRVAQVEAENLKLKNQTRKAEFSSYCENLKKEGKLTPAQEKTACEFFDLAVEPKTYEFSDDGQNPAIEKIKEFMGTLPVQVNFNEIAGDGDSGKLDTENPNDISKKALEYQQAQSKLGYSIRIDEAVRQVTSKK